MEEKRETKTSKGQEEETMTLTTSFLVQAASRPLQGQGQDRPLDITNYNSPFHFKKARLCREIMAEIELEPKFPGSKTCKIPYSLKTQEKDKFSVLSYARNTAYVFRPQSFLLEARQ